MQWNYGKINTAKIIYTQSISRQETQKNYLFSFTLSNQKTPALIIIIIIINNSEKQNKLKVPLIFSYFPSLSHRPNKESNSTHQPNNKHLLKSVRVRPLGMNGKPKPINRSNAILTSSNHERHSNNRCRQAQQP